MQLGVLLCAGIGSDEAAEHPLRGGHWKYVSERKSGDACITDDLLYNETGGLTDRGTSEPSHIMAWHGCCKRTEVFVKASGVYYNGKKNT